MHRLTVRRQRAFTLIELLVVVAIIALLLAILMPSLRRAKDQAQEVRCASSLRSIGAGFLAYVAENRAFYCSGSFDPDVSSGRDGPVDRIGWVADLVNAQTAFPAVQLCPTNPAQFNQKLLPRESSPLGFYTKAEADDLIARGYNTNYTQAWYMGRTQCTKADGRVKDLGSTVGPLNDRWLNLVSAARVPLLGDGRTDTDEEADGKRYVKTMTDGPFGGAPYQIQTYADFGPAHGFGSYILSNKKDHDRKRANLAFGDGHVAAFTDRDRDGEFGLNVASEPYEQIDLSEGAVFDGVLSLGRRSADPWRLE